VFGDGKTFPLEKTLRGMFKECDDVYIAGFFNCCRVMASKKGGAEAETEGGDTSSLVLVFGCEGGSETPARNGMANEILKKLNSDELFPQSIKFLKYDKRTVDSVLLDRCSVRFPDVSKVKFDYAVEKLKCVNCTNPDCETIIRTREGSKQM
jgi:hypothetical protein